MLLYHPPVFMRSEQNNDFLRWDMTAVIFTVMKGVVK